MLLTTPLSLAFFSSQYVAGLKSLSLLKNKPITDVILASTAVEHAGPLGAFSQRFPSATYWLPPGLYSFPLNLPRKFLGLVARDVRPLPPSTSGPLSSLGFTWSSLGPLKFKVRSGEERKTRAWCEERSESLKRSSSCSTFASLLSAPR